MRRTEGDATKRSIRGWARDRGTKLRVPRTARAAALAALLCAGGVLSGGVGWGTAGATAAPSSTVVPYGAGIKSAVTPNGKATDGSLVVAGATRTYRVYVPSSLPRRPVPLLVALHGGLGSGPQFEVQTGFDGLAQSNHFIVVYPNGTPIRPGLTEDVWNAGLCCSVAAADRRNVNDVGFISALIKKLEAHYDVDRHRVFVTGHSNGAMLGERLACQLSGQVDAVAVQSGTLVTGSCHPAHPVAVLEIHGTADTNVPIDGGVGSTGLNQEDYPPPVDGLQTLARRDGCRSTPSTTADAQNPIVTFEVWGHCDAGSVVVWAKVSGANHAWMGHPAPAAAERLDGGEPFMGFDSSAAVWSFLAAQYRR